VEAKKKGIETKKNVPHFRKGDMRKKSLRALRECREGRSGNSHFKKRCAKGLVLEENARGDPDLSQKKKKND